VRQVLAEHGANGKPVDPKAGSGGEQIDAGPCPGNPEAGGAVNGKPLELCEAGNRLVPAEEESTFEGLQDATFLSKGIHGKVGSPFHSACGIYPTRQESLNQTSNVECPTSNVEYEQLL
jgi:hypothetical protein